MKGHRVIMNSIDRCRKKLIFDANYETPELKRFEKAEIVIKGDIQRN